MTEADSLKILLDTAISNTDKSMELISKVDTFYNNAWDKLIVFGSILFGLVGLLVPIIIQFYQRRVSKLSETEIKNKVQSELKKELLDSLKEKFDENERQIKMLNSSANAKIFFSQAKFSLEKNSYTSALGELVSASYFSMECDDYKTLQQILDHILDHCLPSLSIEEIDDLKVANVCDIKTFLEDLTKKDDRTMFQSKIGDIRVKMSKLPPKIKDKPEEQSKKA